MTPTELALLIVAIVPYADARREHFDNIELNVVYQPACEDEKWPLEYKPIFAQVLFRRWEWSSATHEIHAWRMLQGDREPLKMLPIAQQHELKLLPQRNRSVMHVSYDQSAGRYEMRWMDGDAWRIVTADSYCETHTVGDREIEERERWPLTLRSELRKAVR